MDQPNQVTTPQGSVSSTGANLRNRPRRPCDACRKRKSRCEITEGETVCVLCKFHRQPCLFQENPQPRKKRKISNGGSNDVDGAREQYRAPPPPLESADGPGGPGNNEALERRASIRKHP